jgi:hypothetical protein
MSGFDNDVLYAKNGDFTQADNQNVSESNGLITNGQFWIGSTALNAGGTHVNVGNLTSPDGSITFGYSSPNITAVVTGGSPYISLTPYIVGTDVHSGFATIASAIAQAVADGATSTNPKNIYIKPKSGGYTENLTLSDGINLIGFGDSFFSGICTTKIIGKITMTAAGTASVNNLVLQTNGDYCLEVTGANALNVILNSCFINATNANAIHLTNASAGIQLMYTQGACSTNTFFVATAGAFNVDYCILAGNNTTTNSTIADCSLNMMYTYMSCPITTSGTGAIGLFKCQIICTNTTALTHGGSGSSIAQETRFESGTASAVSIGATLSMMQCSVFSTNANAITGAGTLFYGLIVFYGSGASSGVNTATQTALATLI